MGKETITHERKPHVWGKETRDNGGQPNAGEEKTRDERRQPAKETRTVGRQPGVMENRDEKCRKKAPCLREKKREIKEDSPV